MSVNGIVFIDELIKYALPMHKHRESDASSYGVQSLKEVRCPESMEIFKPIRQTIELNVYLKQ